MGGCTEDQRVLILQQLQLLAQQGDNQAAAAFSNLGGDMATMIPSSPQVVFSPLSDSILLILSPRTSILVNSSFASSVSHLLL